MKNHFYHKGLSRTQISQKTNIYPLKSWRTCGYQGVRNVSRIEKFCASTEKTISIVTWLTTSSLHLSFGSGTEVFSLGIVLKINSFSGGPYHKETGPLICSTNQCIGFYMIRTFPTKELWSQSMSQNEN